MTSHLQIILWKDVFVVVDDGRAVAADYPGLGKLITEQVKEHVDGVAGLTVIPSNARPPSQEARDAIGNLLASLGDRLRCACWVVEGGGFQGAMVRAVLTGLRMFGHFPYDTHVSTQMEEALGWVFPHLVGGAARLPEIRRVTEFIAMKRASEAAALSL